VSDLAVLDPDPYWECGPGSRSTEIDQNLQINLVSSLIKKAFCTVLGMFFDIQNKIQLFVTLKSALDPDPDPHGSSLVWLPGSRSILR
jgi:hypothetical protein